MGGGRDGYGGPSGLSAGSWAMQGDLQTQRAQPTVGLQAQFPVPQNYTVQFGVGNPGKDPVTGKNIDYEAQAEVIWKVHGVPVRRVVSINDGTEITAPAEAVNVLVSDVTTPTGKNVGKKYPINITCAPGTRFGGPNILRGQALVNIPGPGFINIPVPSQSGVIGFQPFLRAPSAGYSFNVEIQQITGAGLIIFSQSIQGIVGGVLPVIPLMPGAQSVEIDNLDANNFPGGLNWIIDG